MNRYAGLIFVVIVAAIIYAVVYQAVKSDIFKSVAGLFEGMNFGWNYSSPSSTQTQEKPPKTQPLPEKPKPPAPSNSKPPTNIKPPQGFTVSQISPFYEKIQISSVNRSSVGRTKIVSQIAVQGGYSLKENINITGWKFKSNKGEFSIPQAIANYGVFNYRNQSDIIFGFQNRLYVYSSVSPLGENFRLNKCTGYLNNFYQFKPGLPNNCPKIDKKEIIHLSGQCQNLIASFGSCKIPSNNDFGKPFVVNEPVCRDFLNKFNYGFCYNGHYGDVDFFSNEWRIWLNRDIPFDAEHDRILLFDRAGLLVDEYIY